MGNYCSSGQKKKNKDKDCDQSEDSPSYQLANKQKKSNGSDDSKEAPLADPEPTSDISNQNVVTSDITLNLDDTSKCQIRPTSKFIQLIQLEEKTPDSATNSPVTVISPCDLNTAVNQQKTINRLPDTLQTLYGRSSTSRRFDQNRKIVLYILAADNCHENEKLTIYSIYENLRKKCKSKGFELHISNAHQQHQRRLTTAAVRTSEDIGTDQQLNHEINSLNITNWYFNGPVEAQGGHHLTALCLAEISRHSNISYIIPVLFLGTTLGTPLLPLTIESQDFITVLNAATDPTIKALLGKWYILDSKALPSCYRLKTSDINIKDETNGEINSLLHALVDLFSKELRDSYLTTVIEQEINNTVLINQELSKRCLCIQTGSPPPSTGSSNNVLENEINRRLSNIQNELKNQLHEKNQIRIPPSAQLQSIQLGSILETLLSSNIDAIIEEHTSKYQIPYCTYGMDRRILEEIEAVNQYSKILSENCANFDIMEAIKMYLTKKSVTTPLIIYGKMGSGKSVLSAKIAQHIHTWVTGCYFVLRYANLTPLSADFVSLLGTIAEQLHYLTFNKTSNGPHTLQFYTTIIKNCLTITRKQIVILIDSFDVLDFNNLEWLPDIILDNIKIVLTISSDENAEDSAKPDNWSYLKKKTNNFLHLNQFSDKQWKDVLTYGGGDFLAVNGALQLPDNWKITSEKNPLQAKILWWMAWLGEFNLTKISLTNICDKVFEILETKLNGNVSRYILSLIVSTKYGLYESEIIDLLKESKLIDEPTEISTIWVKFCWYMGPLLLHTSKIRLMDGKLKWVAKKRYNKEIENAHKILKEYYSTLARTNQNDLGKDNCENRQILLELPYHVFRSDAEQSFVKSMYLTDLSWLENKITITGCVQLLSDLHLLEKLKNQQKHIKLLEKFLEENFRSLNYSAEQLPNLLNIFLKQESAKDSNLLENQIIQEWLDSIKSIKNTYLETLNLTEVIASVNETNNNNNSNNNEKIGFNIITNLGGKGYFVASINTNKETICVWDVPKCKRVRLLTGIPQPTSICPIDDYCAAVLCQREIKIINLNEGVFQVTLKGVMNQKMPYYGQHDAKHLVCLSRNRMYVNLMNIESGDCITTFKAGEDRFLNSLLVSGDGRILVCGDETQKPFPLLVWHLSQRKLLYDLRIPHHDFITSLSAITHEGSYVAVVAKELNESSPNFIVVYDLQSGTLFKKWKPTCNTVSLAISQTNACVIAGLDDARILVWDLVTGNCKYTFIGHNAPVTMLKLDPFGKILLSTDIDGRDTSLRLWELNTGKSLAVHIPVAKINTCEILPNGKYIVIALENHEMLVTLELKNLTIIYADENTMDMSASDENLCYGCQENEGKSFQL